MQSWPTNPIDIFINLLFKISKSQRLLVADLGCGDATLARHFQKTKNIKLRSFDLVKVNEFVEVSDMAKIPLSTQSVDIAVFCLSLMGTNFLAFIREACRYTKLQYYLVLRVLIAVVRYGLRKSSHDSLTRRLKLSCYGWQEWD
jgi:Hypothetical methyltransferase